MLPGILGIMAGVGARPDVSYLTYTDTNAVASTYNISSYAIGAAASDRRIFGILHWESGSSDVTLNSASIGGVSATIHAQRHHTGGVTGLGVAIFSAVVPTGTTATISFTFSTSARGYAFSAIRTTGMTRSTPFDTDTDENQGTTANLTSSTNVDASGLIIAAMTGSTNAVNDTVVWTGATEQYDQAAATLAGVHASMAWQANLNAETGRSMIAAVTPRINSGNDLAVVSWS